ncbi:hypothetical protein [Pseudogemmobacter humi]|uniref:hypothetical protein n=1 Tax=Pseudogemmobacter humi TaxID=2483812 RepID=UPI000F52C68E|nr:hypothetical protein [Pseudogemmobacter humi]
MPNEIRLPVYLDQCIISRLQPGSPERDDLLAILRFMTEKGVTFVYSWLNVEESRASSRPEVFSQILDELSAGLRGCGAAGLRGCGNPAAILTARQLFLSELLPGNRTVTEATI